MAWSAAPRVLAADPHDPVAWRQGRRRYAVWLIEVQAPAVLARWRQAQTRLAPWLLPSQRQAHLTVQVCGFVVEATAEGDPAPPNTLRNDDFLPAQRAAQQQALQALKPPRFSLQVGGVDSFDSAAFLQVSDPQHALAPLRQALALAHGEFRSGPWVPHLTLGLYRAAWPKAELAQALRQANADGGRPLALPVRHLAWADYDAAQLGGRLRVRQRWALA